MSCNGCQLNNNTNITSRVDMLTSYDWLSDLPDSSTLSPIVEVRFKGTRKEFYTNDSAIPLKRGDKIVVAASGGHDLGIVALTGKLAAMQFDRKIKAKDRYEWFTIHRIAKESDLERWEAAQKREKIVMIRSRQIAEELRLNMKIGEVEFRGDGNKAIFYYIAEGRVDFRELIKIYAREFQIKIEMKQIGARQEAALIGGIGSCGRELCCSSWRTDFSSINSHMATRQGLSPNAEKLTGRCGKLKCCLIYELDTYLEAQDDFPRELLRLETNVGDAVHFKTDILQKLIWYNVQNEKIKQSFVVSVDKVKEVIQLNKRGIKPDIASIIDPTKSIKDETKNMFNQNLTSERPLDRQTNKRRNKNNSNSTTFKKRRPLTENQLQQPTEEQKHPEPKELVPQKQNSPDQNRNKRYKK